MLLFFPEFLKKKNNKIQSDEIKKGQVVKVFELRDRLTSIDFLDTVNEQVTFKDRTCTAATSLYVTLKLQAEVGTLSTAR